MPIRYRIDRELGVVFSEAVGQIGYPDVEAYCLSVVNDPDYRPGLNELCDLSGADAVSDIDSSDLRKLRDLNLSLSDRVGHSRLAYVLPTDVGFGMGRIFMAFSETSKIEHRVFRTLRDARAWLGLSTE
jgi:hypothetical protein